MKELAEIKLPVFLPGNNRNWNRVDGVATLSDEGEVIIKLKPEAATRLIELAKNNILIQLAFDYRMTQEQINQINLFGGEIMQPIEGDDKLLVDADAILSLIRYREGNGLSAKTIQEVDTLLSKLRPRTNQIVNEHRR